MSQLQLVLKKNIAFGLCHCGCEKQAPIADRTDATKGWVKGQPKLFIPKHGIRRSEILSGGTRRRCSVCSLEKLLKEFNRARKGFLGRDTKCKSCKSQYNEKYRRENPGRFAENVARWTLLRKYGITLEYYKELFDKQRGICGICGSSERDIVNGKRKDLAVDHDHLTGRVRGLLCGVCNRGIGALGDSVERIRRALKYLEGG